MGPKPNRTFPAGSPASALSRSAAQIYFNKEGDGDWMQILHYMVLFPFLFYYLRCWPSCSCMCSQRWKTYSDVEIIHYKHWILKKALWVKCLWKYRPTKTPYVSLSKGSQSQNKTPITFMSIFGLILDCCITFSVRLYKDTDPPVLKLSAMAPAVTILAVPDYV